MADQDDLAKRIVENLAEDPAYEVYGELETSPWGAGQWVCWTDPAGEKHYFRVIVEPFRPD